MAWLAGDVGATNARFALFEERALPGEPTVVERLASRDFASLEEAVDRFLRPRGARVAAAVFGVPGPVFGGRVATTNLPWRVEMRSISGRLGGAPVVLLNDLEAAAHGLEALGERDLRVLRAGEPESEGNRALIAAGTGLGEAGLVREEGGHRPFATEAGHADFAARTDLEIELLGWLRRRHGRVGVERVVSGPGIEAIYRFLLETGRGEEPPWLAARLAAGDPPDVIAAEAERGESPLAAAALDLFLGAYGAEAGNLALRTLATGGVFVAGGIAPSLLPRLATGPFVEAFLDKGRFRPLLERVPLSVVLHPNLGLLGAARVAARRFR
jgi:glucokinase